MPGRLSFRGHVFESILARYTQFFPGAARVTAIFYTPSIKNVVALQSDATGVNRAIEIEEVKDQIRKERKVRQDTIWTSQKSLPVTVQEKGRVQLEIDHEYDNTVLVLRYENAHDKLSDLLILEFNNRSAGMRLSESGQKLTTKEKAVLAQNTYNLIAGMIANADHDRQIYNQVLASIHETEKELQNIKLELEKTQSNNGLFIERFCEFLIQQVSVTEPFEVKLSQEAMNKLKDFRNDFNLLEAILENALTIALNRTFNDPKVVVIHENDILFEHPPLTDTPSSDAFDRYDKTRQLLNRYEESARLLINKELKVTGTMLGKHCDPPISAAAVSDALGKHHKKVITLLREHPNNWPALRAYYNPLRKLARSPSG